MQGYQIAASVNDGDDIANAGLVQKTLAILPPRVPLRPVVLIAQFPAKPAPLFPRFQIALECLLERSFTPDQGCHRTSSQAMRTAFTRDSQSVQSHREEVRLPTPLEYSRESLVKQRGRWEMRGQRGKWFFSLLPCGLRQGRFGGVDNRGGESRDTDLRQPAGNDLPAAMWRVSDRATRPTAGSPYRGLGPQPK